MKAEGWYQDPYQMHEDRWYSDGTPTALVRDADVESMIRHPPEHRSATNWNRRSPTNLLPAPMTFGGKATVGRPELPGQKAFDVMGGFGPMS